MPPRILLLAGLVAACGGAAPPSPAPAPDRAADPCLLGALAAGPSGRRLLAAAAPGDTALFDPARARTPIGLSCTGQPVARTASSWSADSGRRDWTLVVPSAAELARTWRARPASAAALRLAGATGWIPLDEHRLVVSFAAPRESIPAIFADPALAADSAGAAGLERLPPPADLRDAVDTAADLVVTGDPAVVEYAERRGGYTAHALPWSRTYVVLLPAAGGALAVADSAPFRDDLARDAVRTWARAASGARWWETSACEQPGSSAAPATSAVVYASGDPVARALAERIVAIAPEGGVTRGVRDGELGLAITRGLGAAFVLAVPSAPLVPCREVAGWPAGSRVVPLIETRRTALVREGTPPLRIEHDGGIVPETAR